MIPVLLAGFSGIGAQDHQTAMYLPALHAHPGFRIAAVAPSCAADAPAAERAAAALGVPCTDIDTGVRDTAAVSVAVPLDQRPTVVGAALAAGCHVLADKPLAANLLGVQQIQHAMNGTALVPAHHHRLLGSLRSVRGALAAGRVGLPWNVQVDFVVAGGNPAPSGELLNLGIYPIDVLRSLLGLAAVRVQAVFGSHWHADGPEDTATVLIDYANGVTATVLLARTVALHGIRAAGVLRHRYRISGSHGLFVVDALRPALQVCTGTDSGAAWPVADTMAPLVDALHRSITTGEPPTPGIDDALHAHAVLDAAYRSARSGHPEPIEGSAG